MGWNLDIYLFSSVIFVTFLKPELIESLLTGGLGAGFGLDTATFSASNDATSEDNDNLEEDIESKEDVWEARDKSFM